MKKRMGFVSNSSSSSFIIYSKKKLTNKSLLDIFGMPENHPLKTFGAEVASTFFSRCEEITSWEHYVKEQNYVNEEEALEWGGKNIKEKFDQNWKVYNGSFSTDSYEGIESYLCNETIFVETPELIIEHEGGF